jgi:hypothetical protein
VQKSEQGGKAKTTNTPIHLDVRETVEAQIGTPLVAGSNNFTIADPSTIAHIIVQEKTAHLYTHDYVKLSKLLEELRGERDTHKRLRTTVEQEREALKQELAQLETEKKHITPVIKVSSLPGSEGLKTKESSSSIFFESKKYGR